MLIITKAKPNPAGKDRIGRNITPPQRLAGEWVDIKNRGGLGINLNNLQVYHYAYGSSVRGNWEEVINPTGVLPAGKIIRIHSGGKIPTTQMLLTDRVGADFHLFTGKNYVWNNSRKDYPRIWNSILRRWIDSTYYDAYPPDGVILKRVSNKLV